MTVSLADKLSTYTSDAELSSLLTNNRIGAYAAAAYLELDGSTDDYSALYSLINTTINGADAEIWFKDGTAIIGTNITIPSNIKLKFIEGGMLKPNSGVVITGSGAKIEAGITQIFDLTASGATGVAGTWNVPNWNPYWFGAVGDGETADTVPFQAAVNLSTANGKTEIELLGGKSYLVNTLTGASGIVFIGDSVTMSGTASIKPVSLSYLNDGRTLIVSSGTGNILKTKIITAALRNEGAGWYVIYGGKAHNYTGITSVSEDASKITITYDFTAENIMSFICTPDETMIQEKIQVGATVGVSSADIYLSQNKSSGGYVYYDGAAWQSSTDETVTLAFNAGILTITHPSITGLKANVHCRNGVHLATIGALSATTTEIYIRDYAGALVTTADTNMLFYYERVSSNLYIDPTTYTSGTGNIWVYGVMEVE